MLPPSEAGVDVVLDAGAIAPLLASLEGLLQPRQPPLGGGDVLEDSPLLALPQALGDKHDGRALCAPDGAKRAIGQYLCCLSRSFLTTISRSVAWPRRVDLGFEGRVWD